MFHCGEDSLENRELKFVQINLGQIFYLILNWRFWLSFVLQSARASPDGFFHFSFFSLLLLDFFFRSWSIVVPRLFSFLLSNNNQPWTRRHFFFFYFQTYTLSPGFTRMYKFDKPTVSTEYDTSLTPLATSGNDNLRSGAYLFVSLSLGTLDAEDFV